MPPQANFDTVFNGMFFRHATNFARSVAVRTCNGLPLKQTASDH